MMPTPSSPSEAISVPLSGLAFHLARRGHAARVVLADEEEQYKPTNSGPLHFTASVGTLSGWASVAGNAHKKSTTGQPKNKKATAVHTGCINNLGPHFNLGCNMLVTIHGLRPIYTRIEPNRR